MQQEIRRAAGHPLKPYFFVLSSLAESLELYLQDFKALNFGTSLSPISPK